MPLSSGTNNDRLQQLIQDVQLENGLAARENMQQSRSEGYNDYFYWLQDNQNTAFNSHIAALRLGREILADDSVIPNIIWDNDNRFEGLTCNGVRFSLDKLRKLVIDLSNLAHSIMVNKLLFGSALPQLLDASNPNETEFTDKMQNTQTGYSFQNDLSNPTLTAKKTRMYILDIIHNDPTLCIKFFSGNGTPNPIAFGAWLKDCGKFVRVLLLLVHLTSGQPSRMSELTEASTICNPHEGGTRSLYFVHNTIMLVQSYNKSKAITGQEMLVARFLPKYLLPMFLTYLVCVRPIEQ